eukprot:12225240-Alexandrium_andersonii.AAC.1
MTNHLCRSQDSAGHHCNSPWGCEELIRAPARRRYSIHRLSLPSWCCRVRCMLVGGQRRQSLASSAGSLHPHMSGAPMSAVKSRPSTAC